MLRKRLVTPFVGALLTLAVAGCGGSGEVTSAAQIPKAAFVKRANAICVRTYAQVQAGYESFVKRAAGKPFSNIEEIESYASTVLVPAKQMELEQLHALGAPRGSEDRVEAILDAYEEGIGRAEENPRDAITSSAGVFVQATELAQGFGLEDCRY